MKKVFLGGTCNQSTWRDELIKQLQIAYYYPTGEDWTSEMMQEEIHQREICDFCLYVITPRLTGFYSIAELVDDSNKYPGKTVFCFLSIDGEASFSAHQLKSLEQVGKMVTRNGAAYFKSLKEVADYLNHK